MTSGCNSSSDNAQVWTLLKDEGKISLGCFHSHRGTAPKVLSIGKKRKLVCKSGRTVLIQPKSKSITEMQNKKQCRKETLF